MNSSHLDASFVHALPLPAFRQISYYFCCSFSCVFFLKFSFPILLIFYQINKSRTISLFTFVFLLGKFNLVEVIFESIPIFFKPLKVFFDNKFLTLIWLKKTTTKKIYSLLRILWLNFTFYCPVLKDLFIGNFLFILKVRLWIFYETI